MAVSTIKNIPAKYVGATPLQTYTTFKDIMENVEPHGITLSEVWGNGIVPSTEFPSGIGNQKTFLFIRVSKSIVYNKLILFSEGRMFYGYFKNNDSLTVTWKEVTFA